MEQLNPMEHSSPSTSSDALDRESVGLRAQQPDPPEGDAGERDRWSSAPAVVTTRPAQPKARVLVVDDEELIRLSITDALDRAGYEAVGVGSAEEALEKVSVADVVLLDCRLPDAHGFELLDRFGEIDPPPVTIVMTAFSSIDTAVTAMKRGAYHFLCKPIDEGVLLGVVKRSLETTQLQREVRAYRRSQSQQYPIEGIIGESPRMLRVKALIERIARSPATTVLLTGETGTGKDLAARVLHQASGRVRGAFMNITCSALPEHLLESELFGHERGAFTDAKQQKKGLLELANGGTVFLDEIGEMPLVAQAKLLRFLEERAIRRVGGSTDIAVDVRIIAATNVDLLAAVQGGTFREDLYYRLNVVPIELPPLRARGTDVEKLAKSFVANYANEFRKPIVGLAPDAVAQLSAHRWPGNVRELRNLIERAVLLSDGELITAEDLWVLGRPTTSDDVFQLPAEGIVLEDVERRLVIQALERAGGNQTQAGRLLGMKRDQIRYRIEKFQLEELVQRLTAGK